VVDWWDVYARLGTWLRFGVSGDGIRLHHGRDLGDRVDALVGRLGGRCGLDGVLDDLDRAATVVVPPTNAADYAFRWNDEDFDDPVWWPQGITTSADAGHRPDGSTDTGRKVVVVAWYAKRVNGLTQGVRLSFVDVTDHAHPRYRHVLLVEPTRRRWSRKVGMRPVPVHAGGIVWYGSAILVADTLGGIRTFALDDVCRPPGAWRGHDYVLPQRASYKAMNDRGVRPFRFSFVSLDQTGHQHQLIAGEYGRSGSQRLVRFALEADRAAPVVERGVARPIELVTDTFTHMQGATMVDGVWYISSSRGPRPGSLWVRRPGDPATEHREALATSPEDLSYWPHTDTLWNCTENPGMRYVYAMPRSQFGTEKR
jgi:hypothetical protein